MTLSPPSIPWLRCPWARHRTPNCSPGAGAMAAHCSGCVFTVCVLTTHCCVCALGWVKCRAPILRMGHHTWQYITYIYIFLNEPIQKVSKPPLVSWLRRRERFQTSFLCMEIANSCHQGLLCWQVITKPDAPDANSHTISGVCLLSASGSRTNPVTWPWQSRDNGRGEETRRGGDEVTLNNADTVKMRPWKWKSISVSPSSPAMRFSRAS